MRPEDATETAYKNGYEDGKRDAVKHGRWEERVVDYESQYYVTDCSICECSGERWYSYCPYCGSCMDDRINVPRMDGDGNA